MLSLGQARMHFVKIAGLSFSYQAFAGVVSVLIPGNSVQALCTNTHTQLDIAYGLNQLR